MVTATVTVTLQQLAVSQGLGTLNEKACLRAMPYQLEPLLGGVVGPLLMAERTPFNLEPT